ncbi:sulfite exporter TauE/SafE family protein [Desulfovibrio sp. ZJ200]|uniref:sulfite exporter TauE/SafE family protein n=1 Tax=Desulfovibrio sp. ZJ200 TaxID=2709792 RepID=UPI0013EA7DE3|nr:sulfite exporter TauE/SafE family protein [Desulfovibrio sp. ZJ200]
MYFPTAGIDCSPFLPFAVALGVSFVTSMGGVSGAFLLLPFQMSVLGYVNPSVSATNQFFNVLACPAGVWRYWREGRLLWPLTLTVALGTLPGVFAGALIRINWLPDPHHFKIFAGLVLLYVGGRMLWDLWSRRRGVVSPGRDNAARAERAFHAARDGKSRATGLESSCRVQVWNSRELIFSFQEQTFAVSSRGIALLSLIVGLVGGIYGIGGGAIMAPFLVSFFGLPVYAVAGASLFATFLTSVAGVGFYALLAPFYPGLTIAPDWRLGLLLGLGGMAGMYAGARCQKFVPAAALKYLLAAILLFTAIRYLSQAF